MKKFLIGLFISGNVLAAALPNQIPTTDFAFALDRQFSPAQAFKQLLGTRTLRAHTTGYGTWDFALTGGANGTANLGLKLPAGAILRYVFFDVITAVAPAGTRISFGLLSATDIKGATAAGSWTGRVAATQTGAVANFLKATTSSTQIFATLSGSTATAGKIRVFADYVLSE